ncbi:hypothetical protein ACE2AJ_09545 [Aquihabitans daechungensis]|uniref:hypothetical protein n=1 Tax=Aquihabitans daechungensis TaxID=1052257 RepID=UPI003BA1A5F2
MNITGIVETSGSGFIRGWAAGGSAPNATLLNFGEEINVSNMVNLPLCRGGSCPDAFTLRNWGNNVHLVVDVLGYYQTPMFADITMLGIARDRSGLVSAAHPTTGVYNLTFDRPVDSCTATVTDTDFASAHVFAVTPITGQATGLRVWAKTTANNPVNVGFYIQLSC